MNATDVDTEPWDLVVIGGGTAGIVGARTAARFGARVLLIERDRTGGDCLWTGCVPSKALLAAADVAARARAGSRFGVEVSGVSIDFTAVMEHVRGAIAHIAPVDSAESLEADGVTVWHGTAEFTAPDRLVVGERRVAFVQALLATGAAPAEPPIPGLDETPHLTSESVWHLDRLPEHLVVLGGGSIGCELGQAFARLGSRVTIVEGGRRLLPREDQDAACVVADSLDADGAEVSTGVEVTAVGQEDGRPCLELADGRTIRATHLLVAIGRTPRTQGLGLDRAGVETDDHGFVRVDEHLRTSNHRVWAAGDLTGHPQFTHTAGVHGSLAASNAVLGVRRTVDLSAVPRVTYTQPEVAAVGVSTESPPEGMRTLTWRHTHVDRAVTEQDTSGFTRLTVDRRGRIVGATITGPRAGESIGELTLAISQGLRTRDLAGVTHPYPTWNDGLWQAAIADLRDQLDRPVPRRLLSTLVRGRRRWLARDA
ncbi:MAG: Mercuric ion reductase [uncultured Nocardioides sp.]|uniref:Mercuric ion reductase n=1 Tax=uncultured Nocardioides sp. TaxID=198441 RepID=A0A6J4NLJ5_9ACTN|nr:MAG: Mercuric ion reductase [uncultured Nocardioides sp.]